MGLLYTQESPHIQIIIVHLKLVKTIKRLQLFTKTEIVNFFNCRNEKQINNDCKLGRKKFASIYKTCWIKFFVFKPKT